MSIKKIEPRYETSDGHTFPSPEAAERHEEFLTARHAYQDAYRAYGQLLAETQITADGHPFSWKRWQYWWLHPGFGLQGAPYLRRVSFTGREILLDENDDLRIMPYSEERSNTSYRIGELYRDESAANRALLAAWETWLVDVGEEVAELRERVGGQEK